MAVPSPSVVPGLVLAIVAAGVAAGIAELAPVSMLVAAVVLGAVLGNSGLLHARFQPGLAVAAKRVLRIGVVVLGLRLSIGDVAALGARGVLIVVATVVATFFGTQWIARRMGLSRGLGLLVATGYSICGVSAIAAVEGAAGAEEEEVAAAVGLVTLFGSLAIVTLPALAGPLGLTDDQFASWVGASVHDVAQVAATAGPSGAAVLAGAMVVKLTRVSLLSTIVAGVSLRARSQRPDSYGSPPPIVPLFVVGFLGAIAIRSTGAVSTELLDLARSAERWLLAVALVGLGAGVRVDKLRRLGPRPLLLGAVAWLVVGAVSLGGVLVVA